MSTPDNTIGIQASYAIDDWQLFGPSEMVPVTASTEFQGVPQPAAVANTGNASGDLPAGGGVAHANYGIATASLAPHMQPAFHALLWMTLGTIIIAYASYVSRTVASVG